MYTLLVSAQEDKIRSVEKDFVGCNPLVPYPCATDRSSSALALVLPGLQLHSTSRVLCGYKGPLRYSYQGSHPHSLLGRTSRFPTILQVISRTLHVRDLELGDLSEHQAPKSA
jgi:hypothetical protein